MVYHGIEVPGIQGWETAAPVGFPERYLLYTGQRFHYKNWLFFVRAISELLLSRENLKLVCTGPAFTNSEKEYLADLGIEDRVIHLRPRFEDLSFIYSKALAFIFPSLSEGFGLPILEAMAAGCPTLLSDIPVMREIGSEAALYFNPKEMDSIGLCVSRVLDDSDLRDTLSAKGKLRASEFSWDSTCSKTLDVYKKIVAEN